MRSVQWQGFSDQGRSGGGSPERRWWDAAGTTRSQPARHLDGLVAFGEQTSSGLEVTWQLSTTVDWQAERLDVRVVGTGGGGRTWNRTLLLERAAAGWRSRAWTGRGDDARSGADEPVGEATHPGWPGLPGGLLAQPIADVVLDSCPLSHWAPIRRLGLAGPRPTGRRGGPVRPLAAAYPVLRVRLPDLAVVVTRQRYVGVRDSGRDRALEQSFAGAPAVPLVVDDTGVPVQFEGLQRRADSAMVA
ncbi:putative glycolipid-binding domain-containing protein [Nakamurella deserti]|uniref:putative glycolipid-binding domain-containing protein n=1 Tax=Nakamurella deserti TaxID=2164074 RepID=UPI000DBE5CAC|nr:putative glycolipid-binding domain-containing protein [Nakamurella deserti]